MRVIASDFVRDNEEMGESVMRFLRKYVNEDRTDEWIDFLAEKLPLKIWKIPIPKFVIKRFFDSLLPERLLDLLEFILQKLDLYPSERELHPLNTFRP